MNNKIVTVVKLGIILGCALLNISTMGEQKLNERELLFKGGYLNNPQDDAHRRFFIAAAGFEHYSKLSNDFGDFLTQNVQLRFTWDFREEPKDAWAIEIHNAWAEFKLGLGKALRIGHFQPYFGLEVTEDTHGALFQTLMMQNVGFKHDWGLGYKTFIGPFDIRLGTQLGYGMSLPKYKENFLVTTRISTPEGRNTNFALSGLYGRVFSMAHGHSEPSTGHGHGNTNMMAMPMPKESKPMLVFDEHVHRTFPYKEPGDIVRKWRVGYDFSHFGGYLAIKNEAALGEDDGILVGAFMLQAEYPFSFLDDLVATYQVKVVSQDLSDKGMSYIPVTVGLSYKVLQYLNFQSAYEVTLLPFASEEVENHKLIIQLYYFGT